MSIKDVKLGGNMRVKRLAALVLAGALCLSAFTGCGINASETVATLGEQEITLGIANFMCKYQKSSMDDMYIAYFGQDVWDQDLSGSGTTMGDNLKESVMQGLHDLYTLQNHMDDYKVTLTDDEKKAIKEATTAFMNDNSDDAIKEMGATQEIVEEMLTLYTIQWKMYEAIIADTDREVSDEDANMRGISYITIDRKGYTNDSGKYTQYTDAEKTKLAETVKAMETALAEKKLEDVAKEYEYKVTEGSYGKDDESFDKTLVKAMDALKEGEVSKLVETDSAYYFVRIDADTDKEATEKNKESIIAEREGKLYSDVLDGWQKDDGWTVDKDVLAKIDFHHILTQTDPNAKESEKTENTETKGTEDAAKETVDGTEKE